MHRDRIQGYSVLDLSENKRRTTNILAKMCELTGI